MDIKKLLKTNRIVRKAGKRFNIYSQFKQDAIDFSQHYIEVAEDYQDYRYSIMLLVHSLEKGMCFTKPRPFGMEKVSELIKMLMNYPDDRKNEFEYELGVSVIFAWTKFFEDHKWETNSVYREAKAFLNNKKENPNIKAGARIYRPFDMQEDENDYRMLLLNRHSVRDYQDRKLDLEDVEFALKCFVETPTACNRQMCRVYYISNQEITELLNQTLIGVPGFNKETVQYFVITYDLAAFAYSGERQQGLLNTGLCTMNFINGLHMKGIGSCCLQWTNKKRQDAEVRKRLGLSDSERIGIVIGAGYYLNENLIPCSVKRKTEDIFRIL